jgi:hypothetical protein
MLSALPAGTREAGPRVVTLSMRLNAPAPGAPGGYYHEGGIKSSRKGRRSHYQAGARQPAALVRPGQDRRRGRGRVGPSNVDARCVVSLGEVPLKFCRTRAVLMLSPQR